MYEENFIKDVVQYFKIPKTYFSASVDTIILLADKSWIQRIIQGGKVPDKFPEIQDLHSEDISAILAQRSMPSNLCNTWTFLELRYVLIKDEIVSPVSQLRQSQSDHFLFPEALEFVKQCNLSNLFCQATKKYNSKPQQLVSRQKEVLWQRAFIQLIRTLYGEIPIIEIQTNEMLKQDCDNEFCQAYDCVVPVRFCIICEKYIVFFYDHQPNTLHSVIKYSPLFLSSNRTRLLFVLYQIVNIFRVFQSLDLFIGDIGLNDFIITESLDVRLKPCLQDALIPVVANQHNLHTKDNLSGHKLRDNFEESSFCDIVQAWTDGHISNLDYVLYLNRLAGRRYGDPNFHPVVPWCTDFSQENANFRDLSKSKYRLNKGDELLERNYESAVHHVTDVLSEITYFTYVARRTEKSVLCKYVRTNWVPGQYPRSIQRMQEWSPDEAIPEFYTDPQVFKTIHSDLPDLEIPEWTSTAEEFIVWHRKLLESDYVSRHLHYWIDLTFGYKLTGQAAVRNKNVVLDLAENQEDLRQRGVVQLFTQPHPSKSVSSANILNYLQFKDTAFDSLDDSKDEDDQSEQSKQELNFPQDYNPATEITNLESLASFQSKCSSINFKEDCTSNEKKVGKKNTYLVKVRSMQILGCLISQLFLPKRFKTVDQSASFEIRYRNCIEMLEKEGKNFGSPIRRLITSLLLLDESKPFNLDSSDRYPTISAQGLPLPSAMLILDDLFGGIFPGFFLPLHQTLTSVETLQFQSKYLIDCEALDKIAEFQVKLVSGTVNPMLECLREDYVDLVVPLYSRLMINPSTAVQASWLLLNPICSVLGPKQSCHLFLDIMCDNYKNVQSFKHVKLYHRVFVLILMARFRLVPFFENFANLLIEAAGGNRIYPDSPSGKATFPGDQGTNDNTTNVVNLIQDVNLNKSLDSLDEIDQSQVEDRSNTPIGDSEIFFFESYDAISIGSSSDGGKHKYDADTINTVAQSLQSGVKFSKDIIDIHFPICFPAKEELDSEVQRENSIVQVSSETLLWLAHRLGPVLTAKHISRNLLRMMSLCYLPPEGLKTTKSIYFPDQQIRLSSGMTTGDILSRPLLDSLVKIAELYGEHFILIQYMPYCWDLAGLCKRKVSQNLEGGLLGSLAVLHAIIPLLSDSILMKEVDNMTSHILCPVIHASTSSINLFSSGPNIRASLLYKSLDIIYLLGLRIGEEMARSHLTDLVVATFSAFSKVYDKVDSSHDSLDSDGSGSHRINVTLELGQILTRKLAYSVYVPFHFLLGGQHLDSRVPNIDLIKKLCFEYQSELTNPPTRPITLTEIHRSYPVQGSGLSGTGLSGSGNMIILNSPDEELESLTGRSLGPSKLIYTGITNTTRHLRGNWLAYWEHEISRKESDGFSLKQIKLQSWSGHTGSVKSIAVLDNENSFLTGSKDRSVRLWSLRNSGEGDYNGSAQWVYNGHRKSVFSVGYIEQRSHAISCDGTIHLWDPFVEKIINTYDGVRGSAYCVMTPQPYSHSIVAATLDGNIIIIDTRMKTLLDLKSSYGMVGLIRSVAACQTGQSLAIGHSSGYLSLLDLRNGKIRAGFKAHEGEILNIKSCNETYFTSTSLDQTASVYQWEDGKLWTHLRTPAEPLHCVVSNHNQVITASTNHKISVHTINTEVAESNTVVNKLRADIIKGNLMQMELLPLNRLLLMGTELGNIHLIC